MYTVKAGGEYALSEYPGTNFASFYFVGIRQHLIENSPDEGLTTRLGSGKVIFVNSANRSQSEGVIFDDWASLMTRCVTITIEGLTAFSNPPLNF